MLARPIPTEAMPVVEVLRREVPRPKDLPDLIEYGTGKSLQWNVGAGDDCCAMGLAPKADNGNPHDADEFGYEGITHSAVYLFAAWFDEQTDPQATTDAIWPEATQCPQ